MAQDNTGDFCVDNVSVACLILGFSVGELNDMALNEGVQTFLHNSE